MDLTPTPDRAQIRSAMMNRYHSPGIPQRDSYQLISGVTRQNLRGVTRQNLRGLSGLGSVCDDTGAAVAMAIISGASRAIGGAVSAAGSAGKDAGATAAGGAIAAAGGGVGDAWAAACLASPRGAAMGTTPAESPEIVAARAAAEYEARITRERASELEVQSAAAAETNRNLMIGLGVVGAIAVGGIVFALARR